MGSHQSTETFKFRSPVVNNGYWYLRLKKKSHGVLVILKTETNTLKQFIRDYNDSGLLDIGIDWKDGTVHLKEQKDQDGSSIYLVSVLLIDNRLDVLLTARRLNFL